MSVSTALLPSGRQTPALRLRQGDVTALDDYAEYGRIHESFTARDGRRQTVASWWEHRSEGSDVMMFAATNESVAELNRAAQRLRLEAGEVIRPIHAVTLADGARGLIGDEVQTRRNDRSRITDTGTTREEPTPLGCG